MKMTFISAAAVAVVLLAGSLFAQELPADTVSHGADTSQTVAPLPLSHADSLSTDSLSTDSLNEGLHTAAAFDSTVVSAKPGRILPTLHDFGSWRWSRDSLTLLPYQRAADVFALHPFSHLADLGNFGQPHGISFASGLPSASSVSLNGAPFDDILTGMTSTDMLPLQDLASLTVYPQYQAFWYGAPGDVFAADLKQRKWDAPRPITRLRHTEAANEYLFTDAMFTLNTGEKSNIYLAGTRVTIGGASGTRAARFVNTVAESWNLRGRYREQISDIFTMSLAVRYNDDLTYQNGGIAAIYDATLGSYTYPVKGSTAFSDDAFDPLTAEVANTTIEAHRQRYTATGALEMLWTEDSSQVTTVQVQAISDVRHFVDTLVTQFSYPALEPLGHLTDHWTMYRAQLDHETTLPWARLRLRGHLARFAIDKGGEALTETGLESGVRGRLDLLLGPVALSGFGALDYRYDQTAISLGAGGELPLGPIALWGGVSFSPRIRSFLATAYQPALLTTVGDRTPDLDKVSIAEGGLRLSTDVLHADLRGFVRHEDRYLLLQSAAYKDSLTGRFPLTITEIEGGATQTITGASLSAELALWRFRIDQQVTWQRTDGAISALDQALAPELRYNGSLYYRGSLIEGTLDLKVGGQFTYSDSYLPLVWNPEAGIFTLPIDFSDGASSYTDMQRVDLFLFATIKQRATLSVVFYNVLNSNYITTAFYPMYDRALRIGVDWIFFD
ncbi:hypothetical protein KQI65_06390 [bacterium]|nr:hypothetical protein [bacterium]